MRPLRGKARLTDPIEDITPITLEASQTSIKVGLSRRFLLFRIFQWLTRRIQDEPHLNFISVLKSYKILGRFLDGTLHELHRDRNALYFKNFFVDDQLYRLVKADLNWVYAQCKDRADTIHLTITKRGVVMYDNYKENAFNVLLMTVHSGTWMQRDIRKKQVLTRHDRWLEEDVGTQHAYAGLVLHKGGIWIDNKASRFSCDYNRPREQAIYENRSEEWLDILWKEPLTKTERQWLLQGYDEFFHFLKSIISTYSFNIIFDGHSMKDRPGRAEISLGTEFIPPFYMPIVLTMQRKLRRLGYETKLNAPFPGGYIIQWMKSLFPDRFIFSMEINKKLYMTKDRRKILEEKLGKLADSLLQVFDIEDLVQK